MLLPADMARCFGINCPESKCTTCLRCIDAGNTSSRTPIYGSLMKSDGSCDHLIRAPRVIPLAAI